MTVIDGRIVENGSFVHPYPQLCRSLNWLCHVLYHRTCDDRVRSPAFGLRRDRHQSLRVGDRHLSSSIYRNAYACRTKDSRTLPAQHVVEKSFVMPVGCDWSHRFHGGKEPSSSESSSDKSPQSTAASQKAVMH